MATNRKATHMTYFITGEWPSPVRCARASLDEATNTRDALTMARQVFLEGAANVTIHDGKNNSISGRDLIACCTGELQLTSDLKAVPKGAA